MGEYAQMEIDNNIGEWDGGFCEYAIDEDIVTLKPEYGICAGEIMSKYGFVIHTVANTCGEIRINKNSFGRNIIRFYKEKGFVTKKQLDTIECNGDGYYLKDNQ